jgi:multidrug efflux pump subunit AcrA (membrane-fusion protein)
MPPIQTDREPSLADDAPVKQGGGIALASSAAAQEKPTWQTSLWRHKWLLGLAIIVILAVAYASFRFFKGTDVPIDVVQRADLIEAVVASGHIESPFRVDISSQITGTVVSVAVREGETVREGQPLVLLSSDELQASAAQAQAAVAQAKAQVRELNELSLPQAIEAQRSAASSLLATQQILNRTSLKRTAMWRVPKWRQPLLKSAAHGLVEARLQLRRPHLHKRKQVHQLPRLS